MSLKFQIARLSTWLEDRKKKEEAEAAFIDQNAKCPACGNRKGTLDLIPANDREKQKTVVVVQHRCEICHAKWIEPCVVKPEAWYVEPASR